MLMRKIAWQSLANKYGGNTRDISWYLYIYTKLAYHHLFWPKLVKSMAWVWLSRVLTIMLVSIVYIYTYMYYKIRHWTGWWGKPMGKPQESDRRGPASRAKPLRRFPTGRHVGSGGSFFGGFLSFPVLGLCFGRKPLDLTEKRLRSKNWETDLTHGFRSKLSQLLKLIHRFPKALNVRKKHSKHRISASKHIRK